MAYWYSLEMSFHKGFKYISVMLIHFDPKILRPEVKGLIRKRRVVCEVEASIHHLRMTHWQISSKIPAADSRFNYSLFGFLLSAGNADVLIAIRVFVA